MEADTGGVVFLHTADDKSFALPIQADLKDMFYKCQD